MLKNSGNIFLNLKPTRLTVVSPLRVVVLKDKQISSCGLTCPKPIKICTGGEKVIKTGRREFI